MKTKKEFTVFEHIDINTPLLLVSLFEAALGDFQHRLSVKVKSVVWF